MNDGPVELGQQRLSEPQVRAIPRILDVAVYRSRGAALVNTGSINQDQIAAALPSRYHHVTVGEILNGSPIVPKEKEALVVTGYSRNLYLDKEKARRVEAFVRKEAATRQAISGHVLPLLVLSDSLPVEDVFHDASRPWFNGPFQGDDAVWSIRQQEGGIDLVQHDLKHEGIKRGEDGKLRKAETWVDIQTNTYPCEK